MSALSEAELHLAQPCLPESGCVICYPSYPLIVTDYWPKPIPVRRFDWSATVEGYEGGDPIGYGISEIEAVDDLKEQLDDREIADCNDHEDFSDRADEDDELADCGDAP